MGGVGGVAGGGACRDVVKAYDENWNKLSLSELSKLKAGDIVRFTTPSSLTLPNQTRVFDKARFTINETLRPEVTTKKPGDNEFFDEYIIPPATTSFNIQAEVHDIILNQWFGK